MRSFNLEIAVLLSSLLLIYAAKRLPARLARMRRRVFPGSAKGQ